MEEYQYIFPGKIKAPGALTADETAQRLAPILTVADGEDTPEQTAERPQKRKKEVDKQPERDYIDWRAYKDRLTDDQQEILLALGERDMGADQLVEQTQIPVRRVSGALTVLEMEGLVKKEAGGRFAAAVLMKRET